LRFNIFLDKFILPPKSILLAMPPVSENPHYLYVDSLVKTTCFLALTLYIISWNRGRDGDQRERKLPNMPALTHDYRSMDQHGVTVRARRRRSEIAPAALRTSLKAFRYSFRCERTMKMCFVQVLPSKCQAHELNMVITTADRSEVDESRPI
jgi:hypothetical protein